MKAYRRFLWVFLLLGPLLWLVWPEGDKAEKDAHTPPELASRHQTPATRAGSQPAGGDGPARTRSARRQQQAAGNLKPAESPDVDRILIDDSISIEQAAVQLRELAMNRNLPTAQRLEALQHGLNLGIESFAGFAEKADLPSELASHYLHEIINHNDSPAIQIRAYIALIGHPDEEVSTLAKEMLVFQVEDDLQAEGDIQKADQEKLIQLGRRKLNELAKDSAQ